MAIPGRIIKNSLSEPTSQERIYYKGQISSVQISDGILGNSYSEKIVLLFNQSENKNDKDYSPKEEIQSIYCFA